MSSPTPRPPVPYAVAWLDHDYGPPPLCEPERLALTRVGGGRIDGYALSLPNLPALAQFVTALEEHGALAVFAGEIVTRSDGVRCGLIGLATGRRAQSAVNRLIAMERTDGQ